jgi:hypothetical protein
LIPHSVELAIGPAAWLQSAVPSASAGVAVESAVRLAAASNVIFNLVVIILS